MKPSGKSVADAAVRALGIGYTYEEMDCQAFVEYCTKQAGGTMRYDGSNDSGPWPGWLENKARGPMDAGYDCRTRTGPAAPQIPATVMAITMSACMAGRCITDTHQRRRRSGVTWIRVSQSGGCRAVRGW